MKHVYKADIKAAASKRYRNQAGFLVLPDCVLARSGVLQYGDVVDQDGVAIENGRVVNVFRPPDALKQATPQFANLPLTVEHPESQQVNPENAKEVVVGSLGSEPRYEVRDGVGYIICDIIVYDEDAISKVENGEYEQLSAGYETAFQRQSGDQGGEHYDAVQFLLIPNHVALVENGRCGEQCKVCDSAKDTKQDNKQGETRMAVRYILQLGDAQQEITEEMFDKIKAENPDVETEEITEEITEDEFDKRMDGCGGLKKKKAEADEELDNEYEDIDEDIDVNADDEDELTVKEYLNGDEDEEEIEVEKKDELPDVESESELTYEVEFDDGTTGRMDENSYKHIREFIETKSKGDAAEAVAKATMLTSNASRIIGDSFDVTKFIVGDRMNYDGIKRAIIKKVMPSLVTKSLKGDALEHVYKSAIETAARNKEAWKRDIAGLSAVVTGDSAPAKSPVDEARANYLKRMK